MNTHTAPSEDGHPLMNSHIAEEHQKYFTFFNVSLALVAITGVELVIVYIPIATWLILLSLVVLSLIKFLAVIWWFMHLKWDQFLCTALFLIGLVVASGTVSALLLLFEKAPDGVPL